MSTATKTPAKKSGKKAPPTPHTKPRKAVAAVTAPAPAPKGTNGSTVPQPTAKQLQALGTGLAGAAVQAAAGDEAIKREDGVFDGPIDFKKAMDQLIALNHEASAREEEWESLKEETSDAKKSLDGTRKAISTMLEKIEAKLLGRAAKQPVLKTNPDEVVLIDGKPALCITERTTRKPCSVCRSRPADVAAPLKEAPAHPDHPDHAKFARRDALGRLSQLLEKRKCLLDVDALDTCTDAELGELTAWATKPGPVPPGVLNRAHVAALHGTGLQACTRCGRALRTVPADGKFVAAPQGAFVGLDCAGEEKETARKLPLRGSKATTGKRDPDGERAQQINDAKKTP